MKTRFTLVKEILEHCLENEIQIVAYGLAPNPFGFTYEGGKRAAQRKLEAMLDELTGEGEDELRRLVF